ncbi:Uncharacterised protein [Scardovia inopinata]|uniref:Uncharacterized protein n=1 Tax=Scardovia inopinata F0304 TaxID=641146 RepID=W1MX88_SCAIO|nr:hypothetical protein HMPREF9020_01570 [Scardovia inopinata F0304]SUV51055.1 Uncharacterised protein [Scardovia inopinata]
MRRLCISALLCLCFVMPLFGNTSVSPLKVKDNSDSEQYVYADEEIFDYYQG